MTPFQRAELALKLEPIIAVRAKARMLAGEADPRATLPEGRTRDALARIAGISGRTFDKAKVVAQWADDKIKSKLRRGETTIHRVNFKQCDRPVTSHGLD